MPASSSSKHGVRGGVARVSLRDRSCESVRLTFLTFLARPGASVEDTPAPTPAAPAGRGGMPPADAVAMAQLPVQAPLRCHSQPPTDPGPLTGLQDLAADLVPAGLLKSPSELAGPLANPTRRTHKRAEPGSSEAFCAAQAVAQMQVVIDEWG